MRLRRLLVEQYGSFERLELALAGEPGQINLLVAPNGAGKSMLRQAFHDLLFGYMSKSNMNFRYPRGLRLQADAVSQEGAAYSFGWRHPGGRAPADDAAKRHFDAATRRVTPQQLEHLFALDTARLRAGGQQLAQGGDSLGLALLSGTGELISAKAVRAELAARRDGLWLSSAHSSKPLAKASKLLEEASKRARKAVQTPSEHTREVGALDVQKKRLADAAAAHKQAQTKAARLARIDRTRRFLAEHADAAKWLADHPDAPVLPSGLEEALAEARRQASRAEAQAIKARCDVALAKAKLEAVIQDTAALAHEDALARMAAGLEGAEEKAGLCVKRQGERRGHLVQMERALRELGVALPLDDVATLLPTIADTVTARQLIGQHPSLVKAVATAEQTRNQAGEALQGLRSTTLLEAEPTDTLQALLHAIRADRDPARHAEETGQALRKAATEAAAKLASLLPGTLLSSPAPTPPTLERLDGTRAAAQQEARERDGERDRLATAREEWSHALQGLQARPLPDDDAVSLARAIRDVGWGLVYRRAFKSGEADAAQEHDYACGEPLPLVFERHLRMADTLADQRLAELKRVEEATRLSAGLDRTFAESLRLSAESARAGADLVDAQAAFTAACASLGLDGNATIAEARHALAARDEALAAQEQASLAEQEHAAVLTNHAMWARQVAPLLRADPATPLPSLLVLADARVKKEGEAAAARIKHEADLSHAGRGLERADVHLADARSALSEWNREWAACLARLGRPANETPAATEAVLQCLSGLSLAAAAAADLARDIADMEDDVGRFTAAAATLGKALNEAPDSDPFVLARTLAMRLDNARTQRTRLQEAVDRMDQQAAALEEAEQRERDARTDLDGVIAACGANDGDEADCRIAAGLKRVRQEEIRHKAEEGLYEHGEGLSIAALEADANALTPKQAADAREDAQRDQTKAWDENTAAAEAVTTLKGALDAAAETTEATDALQDQEAAAASYGQLLDEYLVVALAEQIIARSVAEVEAQAGSNGISRISAAFSLVTNGDYTIEGDADSDGEIMLKAVERRWPGERKTLAQLSEGTRDQLYLALRLVAIEDYTAVNGALPFVADDILQTFDDARATAALRALLALSQHTQVIILTHHPHVKLLAQALPEGSVHNLAL